MPLKISNSIRPLGRSPEELLDTVDDLKARDVNLISLEERIDTTSASGELAFHVFGAIAHFERRLIFDRTKDGLATVRNSGRPPLQQETVSAIQDLVSAGKSVSQSAKHLGIGPVRTKASKTARRIVWYARRGSKRQDLHESVIVRLMRSIVAIPTLKCRAMARMD